LGVNIGKALLLVILALNKRWYSEWGDIHRWNGKLCQYVYDFNAQVHCVTL